MDRIEAVAALKAGVKALCTSEAFTAYLKFQSQFRAYSWRNQMMIYIQRRDATQVAGFNAWKKLGRFVKKGEKGIVILAPMVFAKKDDAGEKIGQTIGGFRVVYVFDVAQTDGQPIPDTLSPIILQGEEGGELLAALKDFATHGGLTVDTDTPADDLGAANGDYTPSMKRIRVKATLPTLQKVKTLAHECGHWILHTSPEGSALAREVKETEAESVAFLALARFNVPTDAYSFAYIGIWSGGDEKILEQSLTRIQKAAEEVAFAIESRLSPGVAVETPELVGVAA